MARKIILILGMHRCATSAVGGAVAKLGASLPRHLLEARVSNPKGHFEGKHIVWLNDQILRQLGSEWNETRPLPHEVFSGPAFDLTADLVAACIETEFDSNASLMVIKDPRICVLAPIWIEAVRRLGAELYVFYPFREPSQVAASLFRRDGQDIDSALALWSRYVLDAEYHSRGTRRAFFDADEFVRDPASVLRKAGETTGMRWPVAGEQIGNVLGNFVDPALLSGKTDRTVAADTAQFDVYKQLVDLEADPADTAAMAALDTARRSQEASTLPTPDAWQANGTRAPSSAPGVGGVSFYFQKSLLTLCRRTSFLSERLRDKILRFAIKRLLQEAWRV